MDVFLVGMTFNDVFYHFGADFQCHSTDNDVTVVSINTEFIGEVCENCLF